MQSGDNADDHEAMHEACHGVEQGQHDAGRHLAPPQDDAARSRALAAGRESAFDPAQAPWLQQCLLQCCKPLLIVSKADWLAKGQPGDSNGDRNGQTFAQFCRPGPRRSGAHGELERDPG